MGMNKKIKISIINLYGTSLYLKREKISFGGSEVQLYLISKELSKEKNYKINIIAGYLEEQKNSLFYNNNLELNVIYPLKKSFLNYILRPLKLFWILITIKPDIVVQRFASVTTGLAALYCTIFKKKFLYSIAHDKEVQYSGIEGLKKFCYLFGLTRADLIISQSNFQNKQLKRSFPFLETKKMKIIKSGYNIKNFEIEKGNYILWVGRGVKWKNPEIVFKLAKKLEDKKFLMICSFSNNLKYWLDLIEESRKINNLKFIKYVDFNKINSIFKKSELFINTSSSEGFPNTFVQATKNSKPIVSLNVNPDNFINVYNCGLYCDNKFKKFYEDIIKISDNDDLYKKMAKNAYKYAKKNHDLIKISEKWKKLINEIIKA
jgi:glycosyltransferase involved in cell wall biosynthesis